MLVWWQAGLKAAVEAQDAALARMAALDSELTQTRNRSQELEVCEATVSQEPLSCARRRSDGGMRMRLCWIG
jgi:hypothetical protein